jgi:hypothetical protein
MGANVKVSCFYTAGELNIMGRPNLIYFSVGTITPTMSLQLVLPNPDTSKLLSGRIKALGGTISA